MLNVILLGLVSFFADISAEMVYPLIPLYLTVFLGATPALVGIIEGIAESLSALLKVFSGHIADRYNKKKPLAFFGYSTGVLYKVMLVFSVSWPGILVARVVDRVGKGIRTAPRDVLICESAPPGQAGKAFGVHKALDMAGSAIGILIAYILLSRSGDIGDFKRIFWISMIPAVLGLLLFLKIKEKRVPRCATERIPFRASIAKLDRKLKLYLFVVFLFTLGNSSNAFLLLRAKDVGFTNSSVILLYFIYSVSASLLSIPAGKRSDKIGRKRLLIAGYAIFAMVYLGFAFASSKPAVIQLFLLYGVYTAVITGAERAFISEIAPPELKGTMLGLHATIIGIALFPASAIAGVLWVSFGAPAPFIYGAGLSIVSAVILLFFWDKKKRISA